MSIKNDISATLACPLGEHYSPAAAQQGAVLGVPFHGAGEHYAFEVTADGGELFGVGGVAGTFDALFDDRAFIQIAGH